MENDYDDKLELYFLLGVSYITYRDSQKLDKGIKHLIFAAKNGHIGAKCKLWECQLYGIDSGLDKGLLDEYLIDAANNEDPCAIYYAISRDVNGYNTGKSGEEIYELLKYSADSGYSKSALFLGKILSKTKRKEEAISWLKMAAADDNEEALYELALTTLEVLNNPSEADLKYIFSLLIKSHELGYIPATKFLGQHYESIKDIEKAKYYHEIGAQNNDNTSLLFMMTYEEKNGNLNKAIHWCEQIKLNPKDMILVYKQLTKYYRQVKNYDKYYEYAKLCAEGGIVEGMIAVAKIKIDGLVQPQDYSEAIYWLEKATSNPEALYMLGEIYELGRGVDVDYEKAVQYYQQASSLGHTDAKISFNGFKKNIFGKWKKL